MATKNIVPRADGEGTIGTAVKNWLKGFFKTIFLGSSGIVDSNSNEVLKPESVASAINEITIKNAATGDAPEVKATGDNTDIDFVIRVKGTGAFQVMDGSGNILATFDKVVSAVNYITLLNSATGGGVVAKAIGTDTNIDYIIKTKGVGKVQLLDGSDNEIAEFHTVTSAVNFLKLLASATGNTLNIEAIGDDADIDVTVTPKGTGKFIVVGASGFKAAAITLGETLLTPTGVELNYVGGVTSAIQDQIDAKAPLAGPTFTGNIKRSVQIGITAFATGGQASAVLITADFAEISICATGGDSVKLPEAVAGLVVLITNHGAAAADVFPNTDDAINEAAANTAKSLGINASMLCIAYDATNWECLTLAR